MSTKLQYNRLSIKGGVSYKNLVCVYSDNQAIYVCTNHLPKKEGRYV